MRLLLLHGWGFDAAFWNDLRAALAPHETIVWDRGYFGTPAQPTVSEPFVAIGHSLGSLLLAADPPPGCLGLIAINGFDRFTGEDRVHPRLLDRMRTRFAYEPEIVLDDFLVRVGAPSHHHSIDRTRLGADLDRLALLDARTRPAPLAVLHGTDDPLLPPVMRETVFAGASRSFCEGGGHLLPLTHPRWCAERILEAVI